MPDNTLEIDINLPDVVCVVYTVNGSNQAPPTCVYSFNCVHGMMHGAIH